MATKPQADTKPTKQTNNKPPQPTAIVATTQHLARATAQKRGVPPARAYDVNGIPNITADDTVIRIRTTGDNAAAWSDLETIGCTIINEP